MSKNPYPPITEGKCLGKPKGFGGNLSPKRPPPPPAPPPRVQCGCYKIVNKREDYCFVCKLIGRAKNYE